MTISLGLGCKCLLPTSNARRPDQSGGPPSLRTPRAHVTRLNRQLDVSDESGPLEPAACDNLLTSGELRLKLSLVRSKKAEVDS